MATVSGITKERMLASDADSIVDGGLVGDDLVLTTRGGDVINVGNVRGAPGDSVSNVSELGGAINLNTLVVPGYYSQSNTVEAASGTNYPVPQAGMLQVIRNPGENMVYQSYSVYGGTAYAGTVWTRTSYNGVWTIWNGIAGGVWTNLALNANWVAYGSGYQIPQYKVEGSLVRLRGLVKTNVAVSSANNIASVGAALAPPFREIFSVGTSQAITTGAASAGTAHTHTVSNYSGRLDVLADGNLAIQCNSLTDFSAGGWVSLMGVYWDWTA